MNHKTVNRLGSETRFFERIIKNPDEARVFAMYLHGLWSYGYGNGDNEIVDILGQSHVPGSYDMIDAMVLYDLSRYLSAGYISLLEIEVNETPTFDRKVAHNQRSLSDNLPDGFEAEVEGDGGFDNDGWLQWKNPIQVASFNTLIQDRFLEPDRAPLEVGTTKFDTTLGHLLREGFVARWPYGFDKIVLLAFDFDHGVPIDKTQGVQPKKKRDPLGEFKQYAEENNKQLYSYFA